MDNPVNRVHAWWTGAGSRGPPWTDGGTDRRHRSTVARSSKLGLWPLRSTEAHRRGKNKERGTRGTQLRPHQRSGSGEAAGRRKETAVAVSGRWGGSCRLESEQRRAGVSVVMVGGAPQPFIVAAEGHAGKRPTVMALTPLKVGRLDEGIKGGLKGGIKAGE
jgi:hypothetical protein